MCDDCNEKNYELVIPLEYYSEYEKFFIENNILSEKQLENMINLNENENELTALILEQKYVPDITAKLLKSNLHSFKIRIKKW